MTTKQRRRCLWRLGMRCCSISPYEKPNQALPRSILLSSGYGICVQQLRNAPSHSLRCHANGRHGGGTIALSTGTRLIVPLARWSRPPPLPSPRWPRRMCRPSFRAAPRSRVSPWLLLRLGRRLPNRSRSSSTPRQPPRASSRRTMSRLPHGRQCRERSLLAAGHHFRRRSSRSSHP